MGHSLNINILEKDTIIYLHNGAIPYTINKLSKVNFNKSKKRTILKVLNAYEIKKNRKTFIKDNVVVNKLSGQNQWARLEKHLMELILKDNKEDQFIKIDNLKNYFIKHELKDELVKTYEAMLKSNGELLLNLNWLYLKDINRLTFNNCYTDFISELYVWNHTYFYKKRVLAFGFVKNNERYIFIGKAKNFKLSQGWQKGGYNYIS